MIYLMGKMVPDPTDVELLLRLFEEELFPCTKNPSSANAKKLRTLLSKTLDAAGEMGKFDHKAAFEEIIQSLDDIRKTLLIDAQLIFDKDPAAQSLEEVILCYPGFRAILAHRIAHVMLNAGVPLVPRMLSECMHSRTGIDIHPGAKIASPFYLDHGTGIVIGGTAVIGKNVHIYQGVTLGALAVDKKDSKVKRHPTVGDNVIIYANSTILGGKTEIGHCSVIGGNTWLTKSVRPHSIVYTEHKTVVRDREQDDQFIDFCIEE